MKSMNLLGFTRSLAIILILGISASILNLASAAPPCGKGKQPACEPTGPEASISAPLTADINSQVSFSGDGSNGTSLIYSWSAVTDDTNINITDPNSATTLITFTAEGSYIISLDVRDNAGQSSSDTHSIDIGTTPPPPPAGDCTTQMSNELYVQYDECPATRDNSASNLVADAGKVGKFIPKTGDWNVVFSDDFNSPVKADRSGTMDYTRWSSRFPYGDWKNNSAAGDVGWFVNTTGLEPGLGWDGNHWPDMDKFIQELEGASKNVFSRPNDDSLVIQAQTNPWKNKINGREDYLTGMISSHTDPARTDPHGFEFKYGYVEARIRLPREANGFRAAFWLYSDNAYNNEIIGRRGTAPPIYEIDIMEYLPNTRSAPTSNCFVPQADLFGMTANQNVLTYDTIFHTYHFPEGAGMSRSPNNWTFNGSNGYTNPRCALGDNFNMDFGSNDWVTYGVLWESDFIEWYVNDVMVHRVSATDISLAACEEKSSTAPVSCYGPVHNGRMYIMASLHMGFSFFEGSLDTNAFTSEGGPEFEIDHIRVLQRDDADHERCGVVGGACTVRRF